MTCLVGVYSLMKKLGSYLKSAFARLLEDPWIVILDVVAVNLAYWLALMTRYNVNAVTDTRALQHFMAFWKFSPYYSVICILVFVMLRLYGGMWRYAGFNDLNRILEASALTTLIYIVGTNLFHRMPLSVYGIGAVIQFFLVTAIRFSYRFFLVEKRMILRHWNKTDSVLIVGAGENGSRVIRYLEDESGLRPVLIVDANAQNRTLDGIPVAGFEEMDHAIQQHAVRTVILADPLIDPTRRKIIDGVCEKYGIELRDFTGYLTVLDGPQSDILDVVKGPITLKVGGENKRIIPFSPPDIGELEIKEVTEALRSGWITTGPRTKLLERRLAAYIATGKADVNTEDEPEKWSSRVVCLNSATAAEELNLRILGVGPGDEVIVPAFTYTASASAAIHCGATVRFVDIQPGGDPVTHMPEMDYEALEAAINEKTRAIITVDLGGIVCDYDRVFEIVRRKRDLYRPKESDGTPLGDLSARIQQGLGCVAVVADCAHSLGASREVETTGRGRLAGRERRYCGAIAHFTSFSFHAVKNFTTAEGGASTWCLPASVYDTGVTNAEIYRFYQLLSLHGQNKDALAKTKVGAWEYDIIGPWYKCNLTDIMAAIGLRQLDRYPGLLERRSELMKKYDAVCEELGLLHMVHHVPGMDSSNHLYLVRIPGFDVPQRNALIEEMAKAGVATNVHYKPLPMMTAYKALGWDIADFPNTYDYYRCLVTLPFHTLLSDDDADYVCRTLREVVRQVQQ